MKRILKPAAILFLSAIIFMLTACSTSQISVNKKELKAIDKTWTAGNPGGFVVHTEVDLKATAIAERALHRGLKEIDKRRGWRGPVGKVDEKIV